MGFKIYKAGEVSSNNMRKSYGKKGIALLYFSSSIHKTSVY